MDLNIKVEKFLMKQGNRVGKAAIEFKGDGPLSGFHLVGFTICDDPQKGMFVLFPAATTGKKGEADSRPYFFLRPDNPEKLNDLQDKILDVYDSMSGGSFNTPRIKATEAKPAVVES